MSDIVLYQCLQPAAKIIRITCFNPSVFSHVFFRKIIGPRPIRLMLIKFSAYSARQSSVFFSFSSVISFKMRINTEESVLVGGSVILLFIIYTYVTAFVL